MLSFIGEGNNTRTNTQRHYSTNATRRHIIEMIGREEGPEWSGFSFSSLFLLFFFQF